MAVLVRTLITELMTPGLHRVAELVCSAARVGFRFRHQICPLLICRTWSLTDRCPAANVGDNVIGFPLVNTNVVFFSDHVKSMLRNTALNLFVGVHVRKDGKCL